MKVTGYKKDKLAKKYYGLEFSLFQNGKKFKIDIHTNMKNNNFDKLEKIFLSFVKEKSLLFN